MMSEKPGPSLAELRSSTNGEDFRSVGVVTEEEKSQYAAELGVDKEEIGRIVKTRNNSTGQLVRHGAEVVDNGDGDYSLRVTDTQIENARKNMDRELRTRDNGDNNTGETKQMAEESNTRSPENNQAITDSRNETMAKMHDEGAEVRMKTGSDGGVDTFFAPTAEQLENAKTEMNEDLDNREQESSAEDMTELQKKNAELKERVQALEARDQRMEEKLDRATELMEKLLENKKGVDSDNKEEIDELATEDLGTTEDGEPITEDMLPDVEDFPEEVINRLNRGDSPATAEEQSAAEIENIVHSLDAEEAAEREAEASPELATLREAETDYIKLRVADRRWFFGKPSAEQLSEARANYERAQYDYARHEAETIVNEKFPDLEGEEREKMINKQLSAASTMGLVREREVEDQISMESMPKSKKVLNWFKQHPKIRMFTGLALTGAGLTLGATGNLPGAAACIAARAAISGVGAGIAIEGGLDSLQTRFNHKLKEVPVDQLADMNPSQLREILSAMNANDARRGVSIESSKTRETILNIMAQQESDLTRNIEDYIGQGVTPEMARGRAVTEYLNAEHISRESADQDVRAKSMTRGITAIIGGTAVTALSAYFGIKSLSPDTAGGIEDVPGTKDPKAIDPTPLPSEVAPEIVDPAPSSPSGQILTVAGNGEHIWGITEGNLAQLADRMGLELTPDQMEAAIDRGKDFYVDNGFGRGAKHHLWPGDKIPFDLGRGAEWLRYGIENPKL